LTRPDAKRVVVGNPLRNPLTFVFKSRRNIPVALRWGLIWVLVVVVVLVLSAAALVKYLRSENKGDRR
jgi:hypothetical protein